MTLFYLYFSYLFALAAGRWACYQHPPEPPFQPPLVSDCQYILARLPGPASHESQDPLLTSYAPFLPEATFHHASCIVNIFFSNGSVPHNLEVITSFSTPQITLSQGIVFNVWDIVKRATHKIIARCLEAHFGPHEGTVWGALRMTDLPEMWYAVEIFAGWDGFKPSDQSALLEARWAMSGALEAGARTQPWTTEAMYEL